MQRKRKHTGRKEVFCILLCIMMIVGTAFSAAAQSADGESAEPSAAGFQESEREQQNSGDTALSVVSGQEAADRSAGPNAALTEEGGTENGYGENTSNVKDDGGNPEDSGTQINMEENGISDISGNNSDDDREISTDESGSGFGEDGENDGSGEESAGLDEVGAGEGDESDGEGEDTENDAEEDGDYSISWYDPTKSAHTISSAKQLAGLAYLVNKGVTTFSKCTLTLAEDIDLSGMEWEPIGFSSSYSFAGTFDGAGHTISNLSINSGDAYVGLFGYLRGNVQNLCVVNAVVVSEKDIETSSITKTAVGAIAGYCAAGGFTGLNIDASVTLKLAADSGETYVGGIVGYCAGNMYDIDFSGAVKSEDAPASAPIYIGGAAGYEEGKISKAVNRSAVSLTSAESVSSAYIGGLAGFLTGDDLLINCGNIGAVSTTASGEIYTGGLAGKTDISDIENCFNQGSVTVSPYSNTAYVGGLFGVIGDASLFNCYNSNKTISGSVSYRGYLVGNVESTNSPVCDYVYWPGTGSYNSKTIYGTNSTPLKANLTCMGISYIASSKKTTLTARLNEQSLASYDESKADNLYMWSLPSGSADNDPPLFRTEALYPVYPAAPSLSIEKTEVSLHARHIDETVAGANDIIDGVSRILEDSDIQSFSDSMENMSSDSDNDGGSDATDFDEDGEYSCELKVDALNSDEAVTQEYQWQILSSDGENYINVSGDDAQSSSYIVSAGEPGVSYYRLKITCQASYADAPRVAYSDPIKVKTGWKICFADGGMADGSGAVTGAGLPEAIFPVLQEDGSLSLSKAFSEGNYFLGWAASYDEGKAFSSEELLDEYDASQIDGDVTLYAVFREAGTMIVTLDKGDENALLKEGIEPESLILSSDEGTNFIIPDGNDYFTYEGYRFVGWKISVASESGEDTDDPEKSDGTTDGEQDDEDAGNTGESGDSDGDKGDSRDQDNTDTGSGSEGTSDRGDDVDETLYQPGDSYLSGNAGITLTAVWSKLYQVTFETGVTYTGSSETGGVQGELPETFQAVEGEQIIMPSSDGLSYEGHLFKYWKITYVDSEAQTKTSYIRAGAKYTMPAADITAAAQWGERLTVTFHSKFDNETDAVVTGDVPETIECLAGSSVTLPECTLERAGYVFTGWYEDGYDYTYQPGETMNVDWNINCFPVWMLEHEVTFQCGTVEDGGAVTGDGLEPILAAEGEKITLPQNTFIPPDAGEGYYYRFVGWQLAQNSNIVYNAGASYTASSKQRQIVFRAVWKKTVLWKGEIAEEFGAGSGTSDDPYQIATAGELAKMADDIKNKNISYYDTYFLLVDDIDLNQMLWTPIGIDPDRCFEGCFDGGGHTISSLLLDSTSDQYVGLFGYAEDAEITNLNMESVDINISYTSTAIGSGEYDMELYTGAVIGRLDGGLLNGCSVSGSVCGSVILEGGTGAGRFTGVFPGMIGGIAGAVGEGTSVENCKNHAFIGGESMLKGGIIGYADDSSFHPVLINGCYNDGTLESPYSTTGCCIGGITARISFGDITDCVNEGMISAERFPSYLGGIAGLSGGNIKQCINSGNVSIKVLEDLTDSYLNFYAFAEMGGTEDIFLSDNRDAYYCENGAITGGIAAFFSGGNIEECQNSGTILTHYFTDQYGIGANHVPGIAGGIAGIVHGAEVIDCFNSADVTVINRCPVIASIFPSKIDWYKRPSVAGGIVGDITMKSTVSYCCMTGTVKSTWVEDPEDVWAYKGTILGAVHDFNSDNIDDDVLAEIDSCYAKKVASEEVGVIDSYYKNREEENNSANKTEEQFASGEVAYLLGYSGLIDDENGISEEKGGRSDRGMWTQDGDIPALGSPSVIPVSVSSEKIDGTITLGNAYCSGLDTIYSKPGSTVYVSANVADMSQNVTERTETEAVEDGTWYYTYEDTEADTFKQILVLYEDAKNGEAESAVTGQNFVLQDCFAATVSALVDKEIASRLVSSVFVPKEEEPLPPDEPKGSGGGGGHGRGDGDQNGEEDGPSGGDPNSKPGNPNGDPNAVSNENPSITSPSQTTLSDNPTLIALPSVQPQSNPVQQEMETPEAAPDSGGSGEPEDPIEEEIEEPEEVEEVEEDITMFEVIQDTIASNPLIMLLLLILLIVLLVIGGYSRYRKDNRGYSKYGRK